MAGRALAWQKSFYQKKRSKLSSWIDEIKVVLCPTQKTLSFSYSRKKQHTKIFTNFLLETTKNENS